nr:helicase C-terminal domain-containing protein [Collinsella urealyticum]
MPDTPDRVREIYENLSEWSKVRSFGLIEDDVVVFDTETTGLSSSENELIEVGALRLRGREVIDTFSTFVKPHSSIPAEITRLTGIRNTDVVDAPAATDVIEQLEAFVGGAPVIAHNASFDRAFIEAVAGGEQVSSIWIDSLALSRIALPRLTSHRLSFLAEIFDISAVSHRAIDDARALAGVWRILLTALSELPSGLLRALANMHPEHTWSYRPIFSFLAGQNPGATFSFLDERGQVIRETEREPKRDASDVSGLLMPSRDEVKSQFDADGLVGHMYPGFEMRSEQVTMASEIRDGIATSTHRVIEAGTGVGKSIAYLVPLVAAARLNKITVGIATKSNNLADQLMNQELPRLARELGDDLSFVALKGYDHYPCLKKVERALHAQDAASLKDPEAFMTALATIFATACQGSSFDLDTLGIRWRRIDRSELTTTSKDCTRRLCPFFPDRCVIHGTRRRAASADVVVTNHSLLFRNVAAEGRILPPIRHWVIDEAHSAEAEARRQWALEVSADETRSIFEHVGGQRSGALGHLIRELAGSDAATLFMGISSKTVAAATRASTAMASLFEEARKVAQDLESSAPSIWIGEELRAQPQWIPVAQAQELAIRALDQLVLNLSALVETVGAEKPEMIGDVADCVRRIREMKKALNLICAGTDQRYVYSLTVPLRVRAGGERFRAECLDVGEMLADQWFPEMESVTFTSATMSVSDSFEHFVSSIGLSRLTRNAHRSLHLNSSYDFKRNMAIFVAEDLPDPRNRNAYLAVLKDMLVDIHRSMNGSVLTLFTNRRDMEELFESIQPLLAREGLALTCQLRGISTRRLRDEFIHNKASSLFALKSFWEGFDAAGDTLRCVVIPKLPFAIPTDPLSLERRRRDPRAWAHYDLPEAVLAVKQAAGRLLRTSTDTGVLVLADSRLVSKGYGKKFLSSLPAGFERIRVEEVGDRIVRWQQYLDQH